MKKGGRKMEKDKKQIGEREGQGRDQGRWKENEDRRKKDTGRVRGWNGENEGREGDWKKGRGGGGKV